MKSTRSQWGTYLLGYLLVAAVAAREVYEHERAPNLRLVIGLLGVILLFYATEPLLARRLEWYRYIYFPVQLALILVVALQPPYNDFWAVLSIVLCLQAPRSFTRRVLITAGAAWAILLVGLMSIIRPLPDGLIVSLLYVASGIFVTSYGIYSEQEERAHKESQALLQRLQESYDRLHLYAGQAEEMAAAQERNRLAHDLRDSVNQLLFSITLTAHSTRLLLERDPSRVPEQLDRLQELTDRALGQMRSLIAELRPRGD